MLVTDVTSQSEMSWLNASAPLNIDSIDSTFEPTFNHPEISWLKAFASLNMFDILVTELMSHPVMFPLNVVAPLKVSSAEVTSRVSQSIIGPNIELEQCPSTGASARQSRTAFLKSSSISTPTFCVPDVTHRPSV